MTETLLPTFSSSAQSVKNDSIYEHYKGLRYKVLSIARHTETLEELIVYQALYDDLNVWVRPLSMFLEDVVSEGHNMPRFRLVK